MLRVSHFWPLLYIIIGSLVDQWISGSQSVASCCRGDYGYNMIILFIATLCRKHSQGKYENYHPPGGSANKEFKEFLTSMTDIVNNQPNRVSDDVKLNEYGINFNAVSVARPINSNNTPSSVMTRQHGPPPVPPRSSNASFLHNSSAPYVSNNYSNNIPVNNR